MSGRSTVTVTWLDGQQETYRCDSVHIADGVLYLTQNRFPATDEPHRAIPLDGLRIWTVARD